MADGSGTTGIGAPVRRHEDLRLLTGNGRYSDDLTLPGQAYAVMLRSPHAHAEIGMTVHMDIGRAPGGSRCCTGGTCWRWAPRPIRMRLWLGEHRGGHPVAEHGRTSTASSPAAFLHGHDGRRHPGDIVAMVVATSLAAAKDGAERVIVDYQPLPLRVPTRAPPSPRTRRRPGSRVGSNICIDATLGDAAATEAAFARAAHVTRFETWVQRVTGVPMEPRAALVRLRSRRPDATRFYAGNGGAVRLKNDLATMLGVKPEPSARLDAGRRRQFRHPRHDLSGIRAGRLGGASARPAG